MLPPCSSPRLLAELTKALVQENEEKEDDKPCYVTKSLVTCIEKLPQLRKDLRKGATKNLEVVLEQRVLDIGTYTLSLEQDSVATLPYDQLPTLLTALELLSGKSDAMEKLRREIKDWTAGMAGALHKQKLFSLVSALSDPNKEVTWSEVKELADGLSSMKEGADVQKCFRELCQLLLTDLAEQVGLRCLWKLGLLGLTSVR